MYGSSKMQTKTKNKNSINELNIDLWIIICNYLKYENIINLFNVSNFFYKFKNNLYFCCVLFKKNNIIIELLNNNVDIKS